MNQPVAPPGWYSDPAGGGGQRYWDGSAWTDYAVAWAPAPGPIPYVQSKWPWKGAQYGRPASGSGSLADPWRRLAARLLDGLVLLPVFIVAMVLAIAIVAADAGPIFPKTTANDPNPPTPGLLWLYAAFFGVALVVGGASVLYESVMTARFGRTLGKRWMHIRPVGLDGAPLGWGRSFGRAATQAVAGWVGWIGLIDQLWCLWDDNRHCVHDKIVSTLVVND